MNLNNSKFKEEIYDEEEENKENGRIQKYKFV
jgi:hypothetical protein